MRNNSGWGYFVLVFALSGFTIPAVFLPSSLSKKFNNLIREPPWHKHFRSTSWVRTSVDFCSLCLTRRFFLRKYFVLFPWCFNHVNMVYSSYHGEMIGSVIFVLHLFCKTYLRLKDLCIFFVIWSNVRLFIHSLLECDLPPVYWFTLCLVIYPPA